MKLHIKHLKMHEIGVSLAISIPTFEEYTEFMEDTWPEEILKKLWGRNGVNTCVVPLDRTEAPDHHPLSREIISVSEAEARGLKVSSLSELRVYGVCGLPIFARGDRVMIASDVAGTIGNKGTIYGLKCIPKWSNLSVYPEISYEVLVSGTYSPVLVCEEHMALDPAHAANAPITEFTPKQMRAPAPKKPKKAKR